MAKAEIKTRATEVSVCSYVAELSDPRRREEAAVLDALYQRVTGLEPTPELFGCRSETAP